MSFLLVSTDLMASSGAEGAAMRAGIGFATTAPADASDKATESQPKLIAIDLTTPVDDLASLVEQLRQSAPEATLLAYGPHVHEAKLTAALQAGCDVVLSRGQFHKQIDSLVERYAKDG